MSHNLDFLLLHTAHFDDKIVLPFLVFNTFELHFLFIYLILFRFKQYVNMFYSG